MSKGALVALWLSGAAALAVGAWQLPAYRFAMGLVAVIFVAFAVWVAANTDSEWFE